LPAIEAAQSPKQIRVTAQEKVFVQKWLCYFRWLNYNESEKLML